MKMSIEEDNYHMRHGGRREVGGCSFVSLLKNAESSLVFGQGLIQDFRINFFGLGVPNIGQ